MGGATAILLAALSVQAKLLNIILAGLVNKSDFIAYGEPVAGSSTATRVFFRPKQVLKVDQSTVDKVIILCNDPSQVEFYDLRKLVRGYIVFAKSGRPCYRPAHGASSVIEVADGPARTFAIVDQPAGQPLKDFIQKILQVKAED